MSCFKNCGREAVQRHHVVPQGRLKTLHRSLAAAYRRGEGPRPWTKTKVLADERNLLPVCLDCHGDIEGASPLRVEPTELPEGLLGVRLRVPLGGAAASASDGSGGGMTDVFRVVERIDGAHTAAHLLDYPLLPGDLLSEQPGGAFYKFAPGLGITGFVLTDEQRATLEPLEEVPPIEIVGLAEYFASQGPAA